MYAYQAAHFFTRDTFLDTTNNLREAVPRKTPTTLPLNGTYFVGVVEPVLHYTMGGLMVDPNGRVLDENEDAISNLFAAGEVMGGVHGENRLGGSSLLDCVVFGLSAAKSATLAAANATRGLPIYSFAEAGSDIIDGGVGSPSAPSSSSAEEKKHVKIAGKTYDLSDFIKAHPGGPIDVTDGEDISERFHSAHGTDYSLLDRDSIREISTSGEVVEREKKFFEDYGSVGGSWREFLGRRAWFVLHSFAAKYPDNPTKADKVAMTNLIAAFGQLYPCKLCRGHLQQQLRDKNLGPPDVKSREALSVWVCKLHNIVNEDLGKPQQECNAFKIDLMYLKDCGECEVKRPSKFEVEVEGIPDVLEPSTSGTGYVGPWDAALYTRGGNLLNTVKDSNDVWETGDLADLVDAMEVLKKWFRTFSAKDIKKLRSELLKGAEARTQLAKKITDTLRGPLNGVNKTILHSKKGDD